MSRELDLLARQFSKESASLLRKDFSLYGKNFLSEVTSFAREIEKTAKKDKTGKVVLVAILYE
jgi:NADH/NAD ratio-sensing transcriptional regulator Rex